MPPNLNLEEIRLEVCQIPSETNRIHELLLGCGGILGQLTRSLSLSLYIYIYIYIYLFPPLNITTPKAGCPFLLWYQGLNTCCIFSYFGEGPKNDSLPPPPATTKGPHSCKTSWLLELSQVSSGKSRAQTASSSSSMARRVAQPEALQVNAIETSLLEIPFSLMQ